MVLRSWISAAPLAKGRPWAGTGGISVGSGPWDFPDKSCSTEIFSKWTVFSGWNVCYLVWIKQETRAGRGSCYTPLLCSLMGAAPGLPCTSNLDTLQCVIYVNSQTVIYCKKHKSTFSNKMDITIILLTLHSFFIKLRRTSIQYELVSYQCCCVHPPSRWFVPRW